MIDVYKIGATLVLNDLIAPRLLKLAAEFKKVDAVALQVNKRLQKMTAEVVGLRSLTGAAKQLSSGLQGVSNDAVRVKRNLNGIRGAIPGAGIGLEAELARANAEAAILAQRLTTLRNIGAAASRSAFVGAMGPGGAGAGSGRPPALPGPSGYVSGMPRRRGYGGAGAAGGGGGGGFGGGHGGNVHVGPGGFGMGAIGFGVPSAALGPLAAGVGGAYITKSLYDAAKEFQTAAARFRTLNLGEDVNKDAELFARGTRVYGASSATLMETLRESVGVFGRLDLAKEVAPTLAALNAANAGLFSGKVGALDEGAVRAIMRFNDMRGLTDSKDDFLRGLDLAQRMITGSGGALKFTDLEQMAKTGGAAFKGLSDDGVMMLATLAQEQGGARTGTALMSLYQNLIAGRTPKKTMAALADAGLAELTEITSGSVGGKQIKSTALKNIVDEKLLRENPAAWLMKYGTEAAKRAGATDESQVIAFMNNLVSNRQGSNMAANFTTQQAQALRDFNLAKNAKGVQGTIEEFKKSAPGAEADFVAAWTSMKAEMGRGVLPTVTKLLNSGTEFFRSVNDWGMKNAGLNERLKAVGTPFSLDPRDIGSGGVLGWAWRAGKSLLSGDPVATGGKDKMASANPVAGAAPQMVQVNDRKNAGLNERLKAVGTPFSLDPRDIGSGGVLGWAWRPGKSLLPGDPVASGGKDKMASANPVAGAAPQMVQVNTAIRLDSRVLAEATSFHQAKELARPQTGPSGFDPAMNLRPPALRN
ncbi:hypothetical protein J5T34_05985 [Cupriavidus gilardii]|uniref:hypothetical protein n=1 Tax=Cupriavidus gilardii TaxID=82541 RepID=UPI001ABDDD43|nr:hypothetical protein [Cupriavidus gilardii]MBO4120289.1 hypothetical protein [Cupriavidus gilardii]